jgi:hypothetical protein
MKKIIQFFKGLVTSKKENSSKESKKGFEMPKSKEPLEISTSMPFVISIKNDLDTPIENIPLFSHFNENEISFDEKGNYVKDGVVISSDIPEISYKKVCEHLKNNSVEVGLTYIQSSTQNQILEPFIFKYANAQGLFFGKKINPTIDPYQQQTNIVAVKNKYTLDENTSIVYTKIKPDTTLKIYFYPEKNIKLNNDFSKSELKETFENLKSVNEQIVCFILSKN